MKRRKNPEEQDRTPSQSIPGSWGYQTIGRCFYCLLPVEAKQPGGIDARHVGSTSLDYEACPKALKRKAAEAAKKEEW